MLVGKVYGFQVGFGDDAHSFFFGEAEDGCEIGVGIGGATGEDTFERIVESPEAGGGESWSGDMESNVLNQPFFFCGVEGLEGAIDLMFF